MSRRWYLVFLSIFLTGCAAAFAGSQADPQVPSSKDPIRQAKPLDSAGLEDLGPAPELTNDVWINVEEPLRLADLRGKVVLLDMWTFF